MAGQVKLTPAPPPPSHWPWVPFQGPSQEGSAPTVLQASIHLFSKPVLGIYSVPGTLLGMGSGVSEAVLACSEFMV